MDKVLYEYAKILHKRKLLEVDMLHVPSRCCPQTTLLSDTLKTTPRVMTQLRLSPPILQFCNLTDPFAHLFVMP